MIKNNEYPLALGTGHSINPTSKQVRTADLSIELKRSKKPIHELYPDPLKLKKLLNKPVDRLKYYQRFSKYRNNVSFANKY